MTPLKVSVIIPVFNRAGVIGRALDSVRRQTIRPAEVIVVDDGSTDDLRDRLKDFEDLPIRLLQQTNQGAAAARNYGIASASGDLIAFLDSDDEWLPEKLALQIAFMSGGDDLRLATTTGYNLVSDGSFSAARMPRDRLSSDAALWICDLSPGTTLMVRREVFATIGTFDTSLRRLEDWDWLIRLQRHASVHVLRSCLANVHRSSAPSPVAVRQSCRAIWDKHRDTLSSKEKRLLRSALLVEEMMAHRYAGNFKASCLSLAHAWLYRPGRVGAYVLARILERARMRANPNK